MEIPVLLYNEQNTALRSHRFEHYIRGPHEGTGLKNAEKRHGDGELFRVRSDIIRIDRSKIRDAISSHATQVVFALVDRPDIDPQYLMGYRPFPESDGVNYRLRPGNRRSV